MANQNIGNVDHGAHFMGAIFGVLFTIAINPTLWGDFLYKVTHWFGLR
jgi:membrane associated rhomboid family serine protease